MLQNDRSRRHPLLAATGILIAAFATDARAIDGASIERSGPTKIVVRWRDTDPVDVYLARRPDASIDEATRVSAADRDGEEALSVDVGARPYVLLRDRSDGKTLRVAERALPLEQGSNFRDLGGYGSADGRHVRWGRIFRSGGTPLLTDADLARIDALGLRRMIDLRSSEERALAPTRITGVEYTAIGYSMAAMSGGAISSGGLTDIGRVYRGFPAMFAPQSRLIFRSLLQDDGAIAYNCAAGQDRTGFVTAVILSALGVPRDVIFQDYHLSTAYRRPQFEMPKIDTRAQADNPVAMFFAKYQEDPSYATPKPLYTPEGKAMLEFAFEEMDARWGSVDGYLAQEIGLTTADLEKLRSLYLE